MTTSNTDRRTGQHVRECLKPYLPGPLVDDVRIFADGRIMLKGKPFGMFKFFDDVENPLFRFVNPIYMEQKVIRRVGQPAQANFRLFLTEMGLPGLTITGREGFNYKLYEVIDEIIQGKEAKAAKARVIDGTPFVIEFWEPVHAKAFMDRLNELYKPKNRTELEEVRRYPARWHGKEVKFTKGEEVWVSKVAKNSESEQLGEVDVHADRPTEFYFDTGGSHKFSAISANKAVLAKPE